MVDGSGVASPSYLGLTYLFVRGENVLYSTHILSYESAKHSNG